MDKVKGNFFKLLPAFILSLICLTLSGQVLANGNCINPNGPNQIMINTGNINITDPAKNTAGYFVDNAYHWNGYTSTIVCPCSPSEDPTASTWVFSSKMDLPGTGDGWYSYNDYLDMKLTIQGILGVGSATIPFTNLDSRQPNTCGSDAHTYPAATGTQGYVSLRLKKPFVGVVYFPQIKVADIYSCGSTDGQCNITGNPSDVYYFSGQVTVPQNCVINTGTQVVVNLGEFSPSDFHGAGQKPGNYTPKTFSIPISCNDMAATANLTLRLEGTASAVSTALQSDNSDVGVIVTNNSGVAMKPNDMSSNIPFFLDSNNNATVTLQAYPVSTTGSPPQPGVFTTMAYLRVDFA